MVLSRFHLKKRVTISLGVAVEKTSRPPRLNKKNKSGGNKYGNLQTK